MLRESGDGGFSFFFMLPQTDTFYKETNNFSFWFNAEFTRRRQRLRICQRKCFTKFMKLLLMKQLLKLLDFLREAGDFLNRWQRSSLSCLPLTVFGKMSNLSEFTEIKCFLPLMLLFLWFLYVSLMFSCYFLVVLHHISEGNTIFFTL